MTIQDIDLKKLKRVSTYAKIKGITTATVLHWIAEKHVKTITIDRTVFVVDEN